MITNSDDFVKKGFGIRSTLNLDRLQNCLNDLERAIDAIRFGRFIPSTLCFSITGF